MSTLSIGAAGMHRATQRLETSAGRIARIGVEGADVDIATEMVNVLTAQNDFKASAKIVGVAQDMSKALLDIIA